MDADLVSLISVPLFTGAIGYVTNWSGVWMLFYPLRFSGLPHARPGAARQATPAPHPADPGRHARGRRVAGDHPVARGEDGQHRRRQGDREARQPRRLLPPARARQDRRAHPRHRARRHSRAGRANHGARAPRAVARPAAAGQGGDPRARAAAASRHRPRRHRSDRREHRPAPRREADGHQAHRGEAGAGEPHLPRRGAQGAALHDQLRLLLRLPARHPDGAHHRARGSTSGGCCRSPACSSDTSPTWSASG